MTTIDGASLRIGNPFFSLRHKNFRLYWIGMCVSTTGTWMQNIALPWVAYKLTDSPFLLSLIGALQFTPVLLFSLFAGVLIDRLPKKNILFFTQSALLLTALVLSVLAWTGEIRYWHLVVTSLMLGVINTLDMPLRQSFVIELVGKDDLMNAVALNSAVFNLARVLGPAAAGVVMAYWGVSACFFINALSFLAVLLSLFFIKPLKIEKAPPKNEKIIQNIKEGLKYIYSRKILVVTGMILAVVTMFAPNFNVLVPVFSVQILNQQETGYGLLMSFLGAGSFLGALLIAAMSRAGPKKAILYIVPLLVGALLIVVGFTNAYLLTGLSLALTGFLFVMFTSTANTTMQLNTKSEYLGRVMSVYTLIFGGTTPAGNLFSGLISEHFNARLGFITCGVAVIVLMVPIYFYLAKKARSGEM